MNHLPTYREATITKILGDIDHLKISRNVLITKLISYCKDNDLIHIEIIDKKHIIIIKHYFHKKGLIADLCKGIDFIPIHTHLVSITEILKIVSSNQIQ